MYYYSAMDRLTAKFDSTLNILISNSKESSQKILQKSSSFSTTQEPVKEKIIPELQLMETQLIEPIIAELKQVTKDVIWSVYIKLI